MRTSLAGIPFRIRPAAGALVTALIVSSALASAGQLASDSVATHMVAGVVPGLPLATLVGPAPADHEMTLGVSAALPDQTAVATLDEELTDA